MCDDQLADMNATLAPGASLGRIAEIVRNAVVFGPDAWAGTSLPKRSVNPTERQSLLPTDRDVVELFTLLGQRRIPYLKGTSLASPNDTDAKSSRCLNVCSRTSSTATCVNCVESCATSGPASPDSSNSRNLSPNSACHSPTCLSRVTRTHEICQAIMVVAA